MASGKNYDMTVHPTAGLVRSASDGAAAHHVTLSSCDCADFINRKGRLVEMDGGIIAVTVCKHIAEFLERAGGWHRSAPEPAVHRGLTGLAVRKILCGDLGFTDQLAGAMLTGAQDRGYMPFYRVNGAPADGKVKYDRLGGRYTLTVG